ncbi:MAG: hypothetical protein IJB16_00390, partial [Clostridia bacterium]|nr:hypothetical protein [Clostridia bacterium]
RGLAPAVFIAPQKLIFSPSGSMTRLPRQRKPIQKVSAMQFVSVIILFSTLASSDEEAVRRTEGENTVLLSNCKIILI